MSANEVLEKFNLTIESRFIPWSQSRNAGEKDPSLNWKVTLKQGDKNIVTTDYMAGMGHCPAYKADKSAWHRMTIDTWSAIGKECETGFTWNTYRGYKAEKKPILPDSSDVVYSLLMDAEVLDYSSFEDWADCFGYDQDSRQAETIYKACLKIALPLRNALGHAVLEELKEAFQDY